ncbi:MAG: hypothetical protein U5N58_00765 [Actinomycetota bacterium]|nr:hypothetical protein [Actinomycetota bacterium]
MADREKELASIEFDHKLRAESIDLSLPGRKPARGSRRYDPGNRGD